jgi:hypothetical protein
MQTFGEKVIGFYRSIETDFALPSGVEVLKPFSHPASAAVAEQFYRKFYADTGPRNFIVGINPGRFGAGVTGIPFTDPVKLRLYCGIANDFPPKTELSADLIYSVIGAFGGAEAFYSKFYFTSVSPLGFTRHGLNLNYYDEAGVMASIRELVPLWMREQLAFGANRDRCICLGSGKNLRQLQILNEREQFFKEILVLDHPRFIMQYKRKSLSEYVTRYLEVLSELGR